MEATPDIEIDEGKSSSDTLIIFNRINMKDLQQFKFVDIHTIYRHQQPPKLQLNVKTHVQDKLGSLQYTTQLVSGSTKLKFKTRSID